MKEDNNHFPQVESLNGDSQHLKDYWTEHRITLMAFQIQYVYQNKPQISSNSREEEKEPSQKNHKSKRKDVEYEGGFLFPGRASQKDNQIQVVQQIQKSQYQYLKKLFFEEYKGSEESLSSLSLKDFVKIMLELKHSSVFEEFLDIYDLILKEIWDIKFESIVAQQPRMNLIESTGQKVAGHIESNPEHFQLMSRYLKDCRKETLKLFRVTIYCFLAEKHNFNINQFYADAFQMMEERKEPKKKRKTE